MKYTFANTDQLKGLIATTASDYHYDEALLYEAMALATTLISNKCRRDFSRRDSIEYIACQDTRSPSTLIMTNGVPVLPDSISGVIVPSSSLSSDGEQAAITVQDANKGALRFEHGGRNLRGYTLKLSYTHGYEYTTDDVPSGFAVYTDAATELQQASAILAGYILASDLVAGKPEEGRKSYSDGSMPMAATLLIRDFKRPPMSKG